MTNLRNERKIISVPVLESDAKYAERHDRWACAIVRAIQRERDHRREQKAVGNPCYEPGRSRKTNRFLPLDEPGSTQDG